MATRSEKLDLRLTPEAKRVLNAAAQASRRSVSEFVLESALDRAQEALPDRRGRLYRSVRRIHRHRGRHHLVDPASARGKERRDLWFGALGLQRGNP